MAKTNKYTSINFNHILEKSNPKNSNSINGNIKQQQPLSSSSTSSSNVSARTQGRMLVLTRPITKPVSNITPPQPKSEPAVSDSISLRPQGRTGARSPGFHPVEKEKEPVNVIGSPKSNKFVPPHLRPGFSGREERPEIFKGQRPVRLGEEERPKSGGGYDRRLKDGGELDRGLLSRPGSGGSRPSSSG